MRIGTKLMKFVAVSAIFFAVGCGSSTNNDQGVSLTFLGFFTEAPESGGTDLPTGELGKIVPLSDPNPEAQAAGQSTGAVFSFAGVQNNLAGEFVRTERMFMEYFIAGAGEQPPSSSFPFSTVVGPAVVDGETGFGSTLPPSFGADGSVGNVQIGGVAVVPPAVAEWINFHRGILPEPPFTMLVTAYITGITSSGNRMDTNVIQYSVTYTPDNTIAPTDASEGDDVTGPTDEEAAA